MDTLIIAIDPATQKSGFCIALAQRNNFYIIESGIIEACKDKNYLVRLCDIEKKVYSKIENLKKTKYFSILERHVVIEKAYVEKNAHVGLVLGAARGVFLGSFFRYNFKPFEYSPMEIKTISNGGRSKKDVAEAIEILFKKKMNFKSNDESDAIAIAIYHCLRQKIIRFKG